MNNINKIKQYLIKIKNVSPLRIANGKDEGLQLLLVDENKVCISGTTMGGVFRSFLDESIDENSIIYKQIYDTTGESSCVFFYDSLSEEDISYIDIECRPHIRIDEVTQTSVPGALFSECHINEGKTFKVKFEVKGLEMDEILYNNICDKIEEFVKLLGNGSIKVGSNSTFGFGKMNFAEKEGYYAKEFDLTNDKDLKQYLNEEDIEKDENFKFYEHSSKDNRYVDIILKAYCEDGLIIRGEKEKIKLKDKGTCYKNVSYKEELTKNNKAKFKYVIPASTIKGIVHNYSKKILFSLRKNLEILNDIFGEKTNKRKCKKGKKGNIIFYDYKILNSNVEKVMYNRIKIDRFTGGVYPNSLFKDEVITFNEETSALEFKVSVLENSPKFNEAIALIVLTFRDMGLGYVTVGRGNNVGFGRLQGISIGLHEKDKTSYLKFKDNKLIGEIEEFNKYIKTLNE